VHAERTLRCLAGSTAQHRQNIAEMQDLLWTYYRQWQSYRQAPTVEAKKTLEERFDQLFGRCYRHHASLNIGLNQFSFRVVILQCLID